MFKIGLIALAYVLLAFLLASCSSSEQNHVIEVTKFKLKSDAEQADFNDMDAQVEANFTSKQPGFINRQSAVNEDGEYSVIVYWNSLADAESSMKKFMNNESVARYAAMIDGSTMRMSKYSLQGKFKPVKSSFVENMSFHTLKGTDLEKFEATNKKVETEFTSKKEGFLQRVTGVSDRGEQLVLVYWDTKKNSDAALQPFMSSAIAKTFMEMMDKTSIQMSRSKILNPSH